MDDVYLALSINTTFGKELQSELDSYVPVIKGNTNKSYEENLQCLIEKAFLHTVTSAFNKEPHRLIDDVIVKVQNHTIDTIDDIIIDIVRANVNNETGDISGYAVDRLLIKLITKNKDGYKFYLTNIIGKSPTMISVRLHDEKIVAMIDKSYMDLYEPELPEYAESAIKEKMISVNPGDHLAWEVKRHYNPISNPSKYSMFNISNTVISIFASTATDGQIVQYRSYGNVSLLPELISTLKENEKYDSHFSSGKFLTEVIRAVTFYTKNIGGKFRVIAASGILKNIFVHRLDNVLQDEEKMSGLSQNCITLINSAIKSNQIQETNCFLVILYDLITEECTIKLLANDHLTELNEDTVSLVLED